MRRRSTLTLATAIFALGSCGSGGQSSSPSTGSVTPAPAPSPAPMPTPAPTPTPTPTPVAASFPINTATLFSAGVAVTRIDPFATGVGGDNRFSSATVLPDDGASQVSLPASVTANGVNAITVRNDRAATSFKIQPPMTSDDELLGFGQAPSTLKVLNNPYIDTLTSDPRLRLSAVGYALWTDIVGTQTTYSTFYYGYPSAAGSFPASGSKRMATIGRAFNTVYAPAPPGSFSPITSGAAVISTDFSVDYGARLVYFEVQVSYFTNRGNISIGTFSGTSNFDPATNRFAGNLSAADSTFTGNFSGRFYGIGATEFGLAFGLTGTAVRDGPIRTVGVVLGK